MADLENPLEPEDFDRIEQALALTQRLEKAIQRNTRLGIDTTGQLETNRKNREMLGKLKTEFFAGR